MADRLFERVLREIGSRGGGASELFVRRSRVRRYDARNGRLDGISLSDTMSLGLRVFRNGRMGFSYGFREDDAELQRMVEAALFCADSVAPDPAHALPDDGTPPPALALYDARVESTDDAARAAFAAGLEQATLSADPRIARVRTATLSETVAQTSFRNSAGARGDQRLSFCSAHVEAVAESGGEGQAGYGFGFARSLDGLSLEAVASEGAHRAVRMLGAEKVSSGRTPAVLENGAVAELLEVLVPSFLASQVAKGKSMLAGKVGRPVAGSVIDITDDPLDPDGASACAFDDEGVASRRVPLVEKGILRGFLSDSFWARKTGAASTASCRRPGDKTPPGVGISNLSIGPGKADLAALCRETGNGILLTEFMGIHTADPVSGDFSIGASGFRITGGAVGAPLHGFAVSGNILSLLSGVTAAGSDFRWFGNVGAPSLSIAAIDVGGE
ncbi:MAG TPA: TldD/PmbA family protein [Candidatus Deferrimicrobiaceae bacterium]